MLPQSASGMETNDDLESLRFWGQLWFSLEMSTKPSTPPRDLSRCYNVTITMVTGFLY